MRPSLRPTWPTSSSLLAWLPRAPPHRVPRRIATTSAHNAAPVDLPKMMLSPGSSHHNSLPSFIDYAKRTNLASDNTLFIGTHYEYTSALALMRLGFSLLRIGRTSDAGIDLIGHWVLAPLREPLPVIIQCKARKISVNPSHIRELEGSFCGIPPDWTKKDVLGLLVTTKKATRGVLEAVGHSHWPMGFVLISHQGLIQQFVWNRAACDRGLEGVGVTVRHTPRILLPDAEHETEQDESGTAKKRSAKFKNAGTRRDIQLTWMGSPIFPERKGLDQETLGLMRVIPANDELVNVAKVATDVGGEKRGRGRPKGSKTKPRVEATETVEPRPRGRPKGSKTKPRVEATETVEPRPRGRPKGSKTKPRVEATETVEPRPRGRPKGSKNKSKSTFQAEKVATYKPRGRPKGTTKHYAEKVPFPRGGLVPRTLKRYCGRPKGAKTKRRTPVDGEETCGIARGFNLG